MKLALVADVHANLEALDAVLRDIDSSVPDARLVCAGDIVGYGPDPDACLARLLAREAVCVKGNHEEMVLDERSDRHCVAAGILAVAWTRRKLDARARNALRALPSVARVGDDVLVCHGDPDDAGTYVSDAPRALRSLGRARARCATTRFVVCGHTHAPMAFTARRGDVARAPAPHDAGGGVTRAQLDDDGPWLVNPGAVGQARDGVVCARYAILDAERGVVEHRALPYDHRTTLRKMRDEGLIPTVALTPPRGRTRHIARVTALAARAWVRLADARAATGAPNEEIAP